MLAYLKISEAAAGRDEFFIFGGHTIGRRRGFITIGQLGRNASVNWLDGIDEIAARLRLDRPMPE